MDRISKKPDAKLRAGAIIGIVTSAISAVWGFIAVILVFTSLNLFINIAQGQAADWINGYITVLRVMAVIAVIISWVVSGIIIWLCRNVLSGKANNGLAAGITLLIISALGVIGFFLAISAVNVPMLLISGAGIAGGILLIVGKYENNTDKEITVQTTVEASN